MKFVFKKRLIKSIEEYCAANDLDVNEYINELIEKVHVSYVYGEEPAFVKPKEVTPSVLEVPKNDVVLEKEVVPPVVEPMVEQQPFVDPSGIKVVEMGGNKRVRTLSNG